MYVYLCIHICGVWLQLQTQNFTYYLLFASILHFPFFPLEFFLKSLLWYKRMVECKMVFV